jgi:hypothetical protein
MAEGRGRDVTGCPGARHPWRGRVECSPRRATRWWFGGGRGHGVAWPCHSESLRGLGRAARPRRGCALTIAAARRRGRGCGAVRPRAVRLRRRRPRGSAAGLPRCRRRQAGAALDAPFDGGRFTASTATDPVGRFGVRCMHGTTVFVRRSRLQPTLPMAAWPRRVRRLHSRNDCNRTGYDGESACMCGSVLLLLR